MEAGVVLLTQYDLAGRAAGFCGHLCLGSNSTSSPTSQARSRARHTNTRQQSLNSAVKSSNSKNERDLFYTRVLRASSALPSPVSW
eukprot:2362616-Rhodomonas_salina.4